MLVEGLGGEARRPFRYCNTCRIQGFVQMIGQAFHPSSEEHGSASIQCPCDPSHVVKLALDMGVVRQERDPLS